MENFFCWNASYSQKYLSQFFIKITISIKTLKMAIKCEIFGDLAGHSNGIWWNYSPLRDPNGRKNHWSCTVWTRTNHRIEDNPPEYRKTKIFYVFPELLWLKNHPQYGYFWNLILAQFASILVRDISCIYRQLSGNKV